MVMQSHGIAGQVVRSARRGPCRAFDPGRGDACGSRRSGQRWGIAGDFRAVRCSCGPGLTEWKGQLVPSRALGLMSCPVQEPEGPCLVPGSDPHGRRPMSPSWKDAIVDVTRRHGDPGPNMSATCAACGGGYRGSHVDPAGSLRRVGRSIASAMGRPRDRRLIMWRALRR